MQRNSKSIKLNIPMCAAYVLFCLMLISLYLVNGLYAKYTIGTAGSDGAKVVTFGNITLTETGDFQEDGTMMIIPGVDLTKKAYIDFSGSEAATYVFTEITLSQDWSANDDNSGFAVKSGEKVQMEWRIDSSWSFLKSEGDIYVYYMELPPNTALTQQDIIAGGHISVSELITKNEISDMNSISIRFRAAAVQSNGLNSPVDVWESISFKEQQN